MNLSVVVASCRTVELASQTVESLLPQCREARGELVLARRHSPGEPDPMTVFRGCRVVPCPPDATIPELRGAGLATATGDRVLLTEDNCVARAGWVERLAAGLTAGVDVVGGTMGNAHPGRATDVAAYLAEYGFFGPRRGTPGRGASPLVTGANVGYARSVVAEVAAWASAGDWEGVIHHRLSERGVRFAVVVDAVVEQNVHYDAIEFCADRFEHGRDYAAVRRRGWGAGRRLLMAGATPLLPPLLAWRAWVNAGRADPTGFLRALPLTLTFLAAWAAGEAAGYLGGEP